MTAHRRLAAAGLLLALLALAAPPLLAQQAAARVRTNVNLNLRAAPGQSAAVLATIPYQTTLAADAVDARRTWVRVTYQGQVGWLYFYYLSVEAGSLAALPVAEQEQTLNVVRPEGAEGGESGGEADARQGPLFFAIDGFSVPHVWQNWVPAEDRADSVAGARVVVYVREEVGSSGLCASGNYDFYLAYVDYAVRVVDGESGATLGQRTFRHAGQEAPTAYGRFQEAWAWMGEVLSGGG